MKNKLIILVLSLSIIGGSVQGIWRDEEGHRHWGRRPVEPEEQSLAESAALGFAKVGKWAKETGEEAAGAAERRRGQVEARAERVKARRESQQEADRARGEQMREEQEQEAERRKKRKRKQVMKDRKRGERMRQEQE